MDRVEKSLKKLTEKERISIKNILRKLRSGETKTLNREKLKGREDVFRIRKGNMRIIYRKDQEKHIFLLAIERRREDTYKSR